MEYRDLVGKGANRTEIQSFLTQGEMVTTTIRIPANLKKTIFEEAMLEGMSFSAYVRQCAIQRLAQPSKEQAI